MSKPLYKTTIVIWSDADVSTHDIDSIASDAMNGDSYCSKQETVRVEDPSSDKDWDGTEFFE